MGEVIRAAAAVLCDPEGRALLVHQSGGQHRWGLRRESAVEARIVDLIGLYSLGGQRPGDEEDLPDLMTYAFRCELVTGEPVLNGVGRIDDLGWYDASGLPVMVTATATAALEDCAGSRSGVVRTLTRERA